jgi:VIT1/CCC1 family predicted Fe2+/Mn2+ transporter
MGNGEQSGPGGRDDWRVRITTCVGAATCMAGAMLLGPLVGIHGLWPGMLAVAVAIIVGVVLGQLVGRLLFRPPSGGPQDPPPHA